MPTRLTDEAPAGRIIEPLRPGVVLPDLLRPGLRLVFCGTAAGHHSARRQAYYAGPGNRFWPTLHQVGLTPVRMAPEDYGLVLDLGIGLTDLAKYVAGADADLDISDYDVPGLEARIAGAGPGVLAFTSKQAAKVALGRREVAYGLVPDMRFAGCEVHVLPSPSGRATAWWHPGPWQALADRSRRSAT
ncbi:MAG: mismatch-specific DNA-glycosylase [Candidatus Sericytochromatia bacterium]|nr:mismatch-specific DNA-glycosylase [Candidatus Sericytochromatia bacterium]